MNTYYIITLRREVNKRRMLNGINYNNKERRDNDSNTLNISNNIYNTN